MLRLDDANWSGSRADTFDKIAFGEISSMSLVCITNLRRKALRIAHGHV